MFIDKENRTATIMVEVYYTGNSAAETNYLNIYMLQNNILGYQSGSSENPDQIVNGKYNHMHILRDVVTSTWGDAITPTTAGTLITKTYEYQIPQTIGSPNGVDVDLDELEFLAFVTEQYQGVGTKPILKLLATGHPKMNPLDSGPTITVAPLAFAYSVISAHAALKASPFAIKGVMSLNKIPSIGKSLTSAIYFL